MSVIFSRAPLRISLGGGGTDLPSYYREHGGFLVAGAIDKYIYMLMHTVFQRRYKMKYSETEDVDDIAAIRHPILRESLQRYWRGNPLEVASVADVPAGTGMGSSGAFTVALLKGLAHARRTSITQGALAEAACEIEIDLLEEPCGKQDPYVAAHGGICAYTFETDGSVTVEPLELAPETLRGLREQLLLFYTGEARSASAVLVRPERADQDRRRGNAREPPPDQGDGAPEPRAARGRRSVRLRRADARALAEQASALARGWPTIGSTICIHWPAAAAWSAASWSAPGAAGSSCFTHATRRTRVRRWPQRERPSSRSTSSSSAPIPPSTHERGRD